LINCKYMVGSRRCIVITIDRELYDVDVVGLDLWFKLIQRRSRDNIRQLSIPKVNCMREEAEFEVVSGLSVE